MISEDKAKEYWQKIDRFFKASSQALKVKEQIQKGDPDKIYDLSGRLFALSDKLIDAKIAMEKLVVDVN